MKKVKEKSASYIKSEPHGENRNAVPILTPGIGTRISAASERIGTRKKAAAAARVSTDSLQRYIREDVEPTFSAIAGLARASGVNFEWLAFAEGPMLKGDSVQIAPLDHELMRIVIEELEKSLIDVNGYLEPEKKAELIVLLYEEAREQEGKVERSRIMKLIRLAS